MRGESKSVYLFNAEFLEQRAKDCGTSLSGLINAYTMDMGDVNHSQKIVEDYQFRKANEMLRDVVSMNNEVKTKLKEVV
jgi:hypothetical protein